MKFFNRILMSTLVAIIFCSTATANSALSELQDRLSSFQSMRANFQQALYTDKKAASRKSSGKMAIQRPGKFRWDTTSPNQQILVADGSLLWIYDVDLEQATKQKVDTTDSNSPALFLSGNVSDIPKRFEVSEEKTSNGKGFKLVAKSSDDMFQSISIFFEAKKLSKMIVRTRIGQRSEFTFSQVELNPTFSQSTFHFKPPVGVDVLTN